MIKQTDFCVTAVCVVIGTFSAETIGVNFAREMGIEGTDAAALARLRALPVEDIVNGGKESNGEVMTYAGPILDGQFVTESAESAYRAGRQAKALLMIGSNSAEVPGGFIPANSKEELFALFGAHKAEAMRVYDPDGQSDFRTVMTKVTTDKVWAEPARMTARAFTKAGQQAYVYLFSYVPAPMRERMQGAPHASEIPYVFGTLDTRWGAESASPEDQSISRLMNSYWIHFAKTGNPNGEGLPEWPLYSPKTERLIEFRMDGTAAGQADAKKDRLDVIEKAFGN